MKRIVLLLAAVAAAASVADYLAWRASDRSLTEMASRAGLFTRLPAVEAQLGRQTEPARAATLLAWSLLDLEFDRRWLTELTAAEQAEQIRLGIGRLRLARELAEETLPRRPASWHTAMALGVARYLEAERSGQRELPRAAWREPLVAAMALAPGHPEPPLFLASASLSRWSSLSPAEREQTLPVLKRALEKRTGLELLLGPWIRLAPSTEVLFEVIPDHPRAWSALARVFRLADDLERFATAHRRWLDSHPSYVVEQVRRAREWRRGGDPRSATFARRVLSAPADPASAKSFSAALAILPDGSESGPAGRGLRRWMHWALDLCLLGECPLGAATLSRLAGFVEDLDPAEAGLAALATGDLAGAAKLEARAASSSDPGWHRYWVYKGDRLAASDPGSARSALDRAALTGRSDPLYWQAREKLAAASGDQEALASARRELDRLAGGSWSRADWAAGDGSYRLVLVAAESHRRVRVELAGVPPTGAAVELRWDGAVLGVAALQPGEDLLWPLPREPGIHQLEVTQLTGQSLVPGAVVLEAAPESG